MLRGSFRLLFVTLGLWAVASTAAAQEAASGEWINLLPKIDVARSVAGAWRLENGTLRVNAAGGARIPIPFQTPAEYDFRVRFTRESGQHSIAMIFVHGTGQAAFDMDAWGEHLTGVQLVDGADLRNNSSRTENLRLENGRQYTALIEVRKDTVRGSLDGKPLFTLKTDGTNLRLLDLWRLPSTTSLGLGAWESATTFHAIEVRPVSGSPAPAAVASPTPPRTPMNRPGTTAAADDLSSQSDEFDDPATLANWLRIEQVEQSNANQVERLDIGRSAPGRLTIVPFTSSWYQDYRGVLLHKRISGDFIATTQVRATGRNGRSAPNRQFSLAGIMIRTPRNVTPQTWRPGGENYLFLSTGSADRPGQFQFEVKTTVNSRSTLRITDANGPEESIRAVRIGPSFVLMRKDRAGQWTIHERYSRPDMPAELQVGMTVYTDWPNVERLSPEAHNRTVIRNGQPDLQAAFDYFRFARPRIPNALQGRDFANPAQVSDAELLQLFGTD